MDVNVWKYSVLLLMALIILPKYVTSRALQDGNHRHMQKEKDSRHQYQESEYDQLEDNFVLKSEFQDVEQSETTQQDDNGTVPSIVKKGYVGIASQCKYETKTDCSNGSCKIVGITKKCSLS